MYVVETSYTENREPALQFVGDQDEIMAFNQRIIPAALGALAAELISYRDAHYIMEDIGMSGTLEFIPNRWKGAAIIMLCGDEEWRDNLDQRQQIVTAEAIQGRLTSAQFKEEMTLLGQLRRQPEAIWLTPDGLEARRCGHELAVATVPREEDVSPWDELPPAQLELAERLGATHIAWQYELTLKAAEPFTLPVVRSTNYNQLGIEREGGFRPLGTLLSSHPAVGDPES